MLKISHLQKHYRGFSLDCSMEVQPGMITGLIGRNVNNPVPVSLLSGDRKPQIRFLGNHHSGSGNLYHKSFRM